MEAETMNFVQYLHKHNISDPGLEHGHLGEPLLSERAKKSFQARRDKEFVEYRKAYNRFQVLINEGSIIDPSGKFNPKPPAPDKRIAEVERLRIHIKRNRELAEAGMQSRALTKDADRLEAQANALEIEIKNTPKNKLCPECGGNFRAMHYAPLIRQCDDCGYDRVFTGDD